jgi:hypothetical protein
MPTTISTLESKLLLESMFRRDFDEIDFSQEYIYNRAAELIQTAKAYGLYECAERMETDKKTELWN